MEEPQDQEQNISNGGTPPEKKAPKSTSRREFMKNLGLFGAGIATGAAALYTGKIFENKKEASGQSHILLTQDNKLVEVDSLEMKYLEKSPEDQMLARGREGIPGRRWVLVVDLARCRNARRCIAACQEAHQLRPEQYHMNTLQMQDSPKTAPYNMPKHCQHCDNPPCVSVCPVDATYKRPDGIVLIDNERCIGCRFCIAACPYSARIFNWFEPRDADKYKDQTYNVELNVPQRKGTVSKCLFSADHIREGKLPYCVSACPNSVYYFGDENEDAVTNGTTHETVRLSELLRDNGAFQLMPELGTKPRVYYLPPKNRLFPFEPATDKQPDKV
ncbi:MAG TPA: 4Fe-4S dicluster domain-containing protein [Bacteroidales bacterium]|nr:4Fe-4S dicluster domain-containing protein [Bacteroidales bacterium]